MAQELVRTPQGIYVPVSFAEAAGRRKTTVRPDTRAVATTLDGRDITRGYVLPQLRLPPQDSVLTQHGFADLRIYEDLLRDDQVNTSFRKLRLAVTGKEVYVEPGGTRRIDKMAADSLKAQVQALSFDSKTDKMLFGSFYGYSVSEMMWGQEGREVFIDDIRVRKARRFFFDGAMRLRLQTTDNPMGEIMGPRKFWLNVRGADNDDSPYGLGLAHSLYWPVLFKRNGLRFWLIFLEKFGMPTAKGTYRPGATPEEKSNLLSALAAITTDSGVIMPEGMGVELIEAARQGGADYESMHKFMNDAIARVITGHSSTSESTPGRLGGESMAESGFEDIVKAEADSLCETFNRGPARWLTEWNYPGAKPPRLWRRTERPTDWVNMSEAIANMSKAGYRPGPKKMEELFGTDIQDIGIAPVKAPEPDAASAPAKPAPEPSFSESDIPSNLPDADDIDQLGDEGAGEWEPMMTPFVEQIEQLAQDVLDSGGDMAEFQRRLPELFASMDEDQLAEAVATMNLKARALGDATDNPAA